MRNAREGENNGGSNRMKEESKGKKSEANKVRNESERMRKGT